MNSRGVVLAGAICLVGAWVCATELSGAAVLRQSVSGDATNKLLEHGGPARLKVSAKRQPNGNPTGYAYGSGDLFPAPLSGADFQVEGHVTCLRIEPQLDGSGAAASVKYRFEKTSGSAAPQQGGGVEVFIEDNGRPVHGKPVDANATGPPLSPEEFEASNPQSCDDPNVAGQPFNPVDSGGYSISNR
jgi:hypothetical protein